jgi:hypothetical protein
MSPTCFVFVARPLRALAACFLAGFPRISISSFDVLSCLQDESWHAMASDRAS